MREVWHQQHPHPAAAEKKATHKAREVLAHTRQREQAIEYITRNRFLTDPAVFFASISFSHHPLMLTHYTLEELVGMRTFTVPQRMMGYALKDTPRGCEIVGVHNNEPHIHGMGEYLVRSAIANGGECLDHYGSDKLNQLYQSAGLFEVARIPFDPQYDLDGSFQATYGPLPVIYRTLPKNRTLR